MTNTYIDAIFHMDPKFTSPDVFESELKNVIDQFGTDAGFDNTFIRMMRVVRKRLYEVEPSRTTTIADFKITKYDKYRRPGTPNHFTKYRCRLNGY